MCTTIIRSGELFAVVMPSRRTSSGRRGSAIDTRFWTSTCASSRSVPSRKVMVSAIEPSPDGIGRHVEHVLDAVDLLLKRGRDGCRYRFGVGARILRPDDNGGRGDFRILGRRKLRVGDQADDERGRSRRPKRRSGDRRRNARTSLRQSHGFGFRRQCDQFRRHLDAGPDPHQAIDHDGFIAGQALANDAVAIDARAGAHRLG